MLSIMRRLEPLWFSGTGRFALSMTKARQFSLSTLPRAVEDSQRVSGRAMADDAGASLKSRGQVGWSKTVFPKQAHDATYPRGKHGKFETFSVRGWSGKAESMTGNLLG